MQADDEFDLGKIDVRSLNPAQWDALLRDGDRRARVERSRAAHDLFGGLFRRLKRAVKQFFWLDAPAQAQAER